MCQARGLIASFSFAFCQSGTNGKPCPNCDAEGAILPPQLGKHQGRRLLVATPPPRDLVASCLFNAVSAHRDHLGTAFSGHDVWLSCQSTRLDLESQSREHETTCSSFHRGSFADAPSPVPSAPPLSSLRLQGSSGSRDVTPGRVIKV